MRRRRLVDVRHRIVCGTLEAVQQVLSPLGWQSNTAFVERLTLSLRQPVATLGRRTTTLGKGADGVRPQVALYHGYHNFGLPHSSCRQPLAEPLAPNGSGSVTLGRPCTPALAAGVTDHGWSLREVVLYRVPPWSQPHAL